MTDEEMKQHVDEHYTLKVITSGAQAEKRNDDD